MPIPATSRPAVLVIASAVLSLLIAACSRGSSPSAAGPSGAPPAGGARSPSGVAYSQCMRGHGVPTFPDPGTGGQVPKTTAQRLGVNSARLEDAQRSCRPLLPDSGGSLATSLRQCEEAGDCPQAMVQQVMTQLRRFSACMRTHGVPKWPDPVLDSEGRPAVNIKPWNLGVDPDSNQVNTEMDECRSVEHPQVPTPIVEYLSPRSGETG